jgi:hypothetical protein
MNLNENLSGTQITDELFRRSSVTAARLAHDTIRANTFTIRTESGGGGTLLVLNTDYTLGGIDPRLTIDAEVNVFTTVAIINATYHNVDLYATYLTVGDYAKAGDSVPNNFIVEPVTGNHTATAPTAHGRTTVIVDATTATITIPDGVPVGGEVLVKKIASTQGTITIARTGSDVFTRASLTSVTLNADGDFWLMQKVSATRWDLIDGVESGESSHTPTRGVYLRSANGVQVCTLLNASIVDYPEGSGAGAFLWTYPVSFIDTDIIVLTSSTQTLLGGPRIVTTITPVSTSEIRGTRYVADSGAATSGPFSVEATGRWYE